MGPMEPGAQFSIRLPQGHQPLADAVFESLRQAIIDGRLPAGQWLRQEWVLARCLCEKR